MNGIAFSPLKEGLGEVLKKRKEPCGSFFFLLNSAFLNTSLLTCEVAEVVDLRATNLTVLVDSNALDERAVHRKDTLNTYVARHFADGEAFFVFAAVDSDYIATELLNTLLVTLFNTISHGDLVTGFECRKLFFLTGECLFGNLNQIHFCLIIKRLRRRVCTTIRCLPACGFASLRQPPTSIARDSAQNRLQSYDKKMKLPNAGLFSMSFFHPVFRSFYTDYAEKAMHKPYKQRLICLAKANSFYVLSTSFLRNRYYEVWFCIFCIFGTNYAGGVAYVRKLL